MQTDDLHEQTRRIEELIGRLEACSDPATLAAARELVQAVMDLHGAAFERMLGTIADSGAAGEQILHRLGGDDLVGSVMALYGLHPLPFEARVADAVEKFRVSHRMGGDDLQLLGIEQGVVRLRLKAGGSGCGSAGVSLQSAVEDAIREAVPDLAQLFIERAEESVLLPVEMLTGARPKLAVKEAGQ